ncbi:MAG: hypothetical protein IPG92_02220 [Flavobacteriales bacterium]|nr:hypothetical protein [Flavobacteriales bacterium]
MYTLLHRCRPNTLLAHVLVVLCALPASAQKNTQTPVLFHGFLDASIISTDVEGNISNGPRTGLELTHNPTGWGIGYAHQAMKYRGTGPTLRGDGWFGPWSQDPEDRVVFNSLMVTKEFHVNTPAFRPGLEAGISFINYKREVLEPYETLTQLEHYIAHTEKAIGVDLRAKILIAFTPHFGVEAAVQANFNELRPYTSFAIGMAVGLVRPPRPKKILD